MNLSSLQRSGRRGLFTQYGHLFERPIYWMCQVHKMANVYLKIEIQKSSDVAHLSSVGPSEPKFFPMM